MKFTKMHGIGNDYIYVNCFNEKIEKPSECAKSWSDRHFGIGADGLVLILPSEIADFKMDMYNSDGSQAEMCGNATRCIAKYVYDNNLIDKKEITLETLSGIKKLELIIEEDEVTNVTVDMGIPIFTSDIIPINTNMKQVINYPITISSFNCNITCVSMGNPHTIIFLDENTERFDFENIGKTIENYYLFPRKTNVEFANIIDRNNIQMRVWERGTGETLSCGTGACATLAAAVVNDYCDRKAIVHLKGGDLFVEWDDITNHIYMTGTATKVFDGEIY